MVTEGQIVLTIKQNLLTNFKTIYIENKSVKYEAEKKDVIPSGRKHPPAVASS